MVRLRPSRPLHLLATAKTPARHTPAFRRRRSGNSSAPPLRRPADRRAVLTAAATAAAAAAARLRKKPPPRAAPTIVSTAPTSPLVAPRAACHVAAAPLRFGAAVAVAAASSSATPGLDSRFCEGRRPFVLTPPHPTPRANPHPTPAPGDRFGLGAGCGSGRTATRRSCRGRPARQCEPAVAPSCRHR